MALDLCRVFRPDTVSLELKSPDKESAIAELVDLLVAAGDVPDRRAALEAVLERERKMSTGMQHGIAIPHGKTDTVSGVVAAVGVHHRGLEFQSLDGKPAHIVVLTVSAQGLSGPHVQFLAHIARLLEDARVRDGLLRARDKVQVVDLLVIPPRT